ncbi:chromosome partition protein Smc isoform X2 [Parasteatoda tepidariorum]|uniref:chromosome partition protein Smc isoform X2 n=1 Tax=Parasteatoda tepidariorum TaxID=114398 RepID=UPI00077F87A3|nr:uncharacterized protein LOC107456185 isoform X2 [Parasteatoda tepidariorum]
MPRKKKIEIDDLVNIHIDPNYPTEEQSIRPKLRKKAKSKPQKKTLPVIKHKSQIRKDQLTNIESREVSACSYQPKSLNKNPVEALINDISFAHSENLNESDSFLEDLDEMNKGDLWEQFTMLQTLHRKEKELEIAILYEKLKQEEEFLTDESLLKEKISKLEDEVQKRKMDLKLKEIMCSEVQFMETIRKISLPCSLKKDGEVYDFSDGERGLILGLLLKKEQLKRELSSGQVEIAKIEENCRKMNLAIESGERNSSSERLDVNTMDSEDFKDLECLKTANQKINSRIQLFAKLLQFLIEAIESEHNLNDDLKILASACEKIQHWNYDDVDELGELCKKVHSIKIK